MTDEEKSLLIQVLDNFIVDRLTHHQEYWRTEIDMAYKLYLEFGGYFTLAELEKIATRRVK